MREITELDEHEELIESLLQRQKLLERLARIQRSVSHHAPLPEVLDAISTGAGELLDGEIVGVRLIDQDDPNYCLLVSSAGMSEELADELSRTPVAKGVGGLAIRQNRLVVAHDYQKTAEAHDPLVERGLRAAMAAPVHEGTEVVGSLVVGTFDTEHRYSQTEQDVLLAFAQHASLALNDAKLLEAMREAQRSKEMFLAMVAHELKTPLTAIMGVMGVLHKHYERLSKELREEMLTSSYERAQDLNQLINRLLAGARAELAAHNDDAFLPTLVAEACKGFDQTRRLVISGIPDVPLIVDSKAVREVLGILLENAVSHSPEGSRITVQGAVDDREVRVSVGNVGSLPEDVDYSSLFQAFRRGGGDNSVGVGLGLFIAWRIAQSMRGKIQVSSHDDVVEFTLRFPYQAVASLDHAASAS